MQAEQDALDTVLARLPETALTGQIDPVRAQAVLAQMEPLLATDDTAVGDLFAANQPLLLATLGTGALQLQRQVQSFDYPAALVTVRELIRQGANS